MLASKKCVAALFCCPGNYGVIHAIANIGIPTFSGRHEGAMTRSADAFIRVSGELVVASGTEGPGFTDMICGVACSNAPALPARRREQHGAVPGKTPLPASSLRVSSPRPTA